MFRIKYVLVAMIALATAVSIPFYCFARHPADGYPISSDWRSDQSVYPGPEWNYGDLTFEDPNNMQEFESLSQLEQYMLAGIKDYPKAGDGQLQPWQRVVWVMVAKYYLEYGTVPEELTEEIIRAVPGHEQVSSTFLEIYKNPLTGQWPKLKLASPSLGDLYMRPLTQSELEHYGDLDFFYKKLWIDHLAMDHDADPDTPVTKRFTVPIKITLPVFYVRVYGYNGVIANGFMLLRAMRICL